MNGIHIPRTAIVAISFFAIACNTKDPEYKSPEGYNLNKAEKYFMPESLQEISGVALNGGTADTMFAIQDEQGKLYYFPIGKKESTHVKFGKQADYEDVSICNGTVIVLRSNGTLITFPLNSIASTEYEGAKDWKDLIPKGEYESLYADPATNNVYVLCKSCEDDKASESITGYTLKLNSDSLSAGGNFRIDVSQIEALGQDKKIHFRPSAMSRNPRTGEWYVVASINKMLVVFDANWKTKQVFELDPSLFRQPEGMVFDNQNNLYISNEGDDLNTATVLKFVYSGR